MNDDLTHTRADGSSHMVDVGAKAVTERRATAVAELRTRADVVERIATGDLPKGEALSVARIAGIMAVKQTSTLIPLCHPLPISAITVDFEIGADRVVVRVEVRVTARTGVEMEALTGASIAALTLFDMVKAVDPAAQITDIRVVEKRGGASGDRTAP